MLSSEKKRSVITTMSPPNFNPKIRPTSTPDETKPRDLQSKKERESESFGIGGSPCLNPLRRYCSLFTFSFRMKEKHIDLTHLITNQTKFRAYLRRNITSSRKSYSIRSQALGILILRARTFYSQNDLFTQYRALQNQ